MPKRSGGSGLIEQVQRECRVVFVGPTTLKALVNSLQMGIRTLAIQKRSSEVWNLLADSEDGVRKIRRPTRWGEEEVAGSLQQDRGNRCSLAGNHETAAGSGGVAE